ncbi:MAG: hypothetical protein KA885_09965 [Spirochaetes bacterium]|nr:hypothetical protein [Spirochaetota bacterium]
MRNRINPIFIDIDVIFIRSLKSYNYISYHTLHGVP